MYKTITSVAQLAFVKTCIRRKECWALKSKQERDNFIVLYPLPLNIVSNVSHGNTPASQLLALIFRDALIQNVHAGSNVYSGA